MSSTSKSEEQLLKIILLPRVTEKATRIEKDGQYIFSVLNDANKIQVKCAVELLFNVKVNRVCIVNPNKKIKKRGSLLGKRKAYKKAYVSLENGQRIDLSVG